MREGRVRGMCALLALLPAGVWGSMVDFADVAQMPGGYYIGADGMGGFSSGGIFFPTSYDDTWGVWGGFAYSHVSGSTISSEHIAERNFFPYQYHSASGGAATGNTFGLAYVSGSLELVLPEGSRTPLSMAVTNSLWAWGSMTYGDDFAKQFGAADEDFFRLIIRGLGVDDNELGSLEVFLADFRSADASEHFILDEWLKVDLTSLGDGVHTLAFSMDSSDVGDWGMNTPSYFAFDELTVIPEPRLTVLLTAGVALGITLLIRRRRR